MKRKTIVGLIAIVAIVVVAMFAGCVEKPPSVPTAKPTPPQKTELSLGESAIVNNISFMVIEYEFAGSYIDKYNQTVYPPEGAKFLWVHVKAKNVDEVARDLPSSIYLLYKDTHITSYSAYYRAGERERYGVYWDVYPNISKEGWDIYAVPEGIDISQAKIRVVIPTKENGFEETLTWCLAS